MVRHGQSIHGHHGSAESKVKTPFFADLPRSWTRISTEGLGRNAGLFVADSATTTTSCTSRSANPTTSSNAAEFRNVRFDQVLHAVEQNVLRDEGDEVSIIAKAGEEAYLTAMRFVQGNILHQEISRHIPQDVKIAVALRDRGAAPTSTTSGNDARQRRGCSTTTVSFPSLWVGRNASGTSRCIAKPTIRRKATRWISPKRSLNSLEVCYHEQKHKRRTSR